MQVQKMKRSLYFYTKNSPRFLFFEVFSFLTRKRRWSAVQNSSISFPLIWNNLINYSAQVYNSTYQSLLDIMCVLSICFEKYWKDILWKSFSFTVLKATYETWKRNLVSYNIIMKEYYWSRKGEKVIWYWGDY